MWPFWRRWLSPPLLLLLLLASTVLADGSSSSARARRLAQGPPRGRPSSTELVSLEDILAGIDLSKGPKAVEVQLAASDSQRPAVVVSVKISDLFPDEGHPGPQGPAQIPPPAPGSGRKLNGQHTQLNSKLLQAPTAQAAPTAAGLFSSMQNRKLLHAAASTSSVPAASSQQLSWSLQDLNQGHHASQRRLAQRPSGIEGWLETASTKDRENFKALQESVRGSSGSSGSSSSGGGRSTTRPSIADVDSPPGHRRLLDAHYGRAVGHGSSSSSSNLERIGVQPQTGFQLLARKLAAVGAAPAGSISRAALSATSGTALASATVGNSRTAAPKTKDAQVNTPVKPSTVGDPAEYTSQLEPPPVVKATGSAADETPRSTRRDDLSQWAEGAPVDAQKGLAEIGATKLTTGRQNVKLTDLGLDPKP